MGGRHDRAEIDRLAERPVIRVEQPATPVRAPALTPATRQHAALPPPSARKPTVPAAVAATSSTSQSDKDALENVVELIRKRKPADATQVEATISDPVARKLAEWLILRSDNNGASMERYRAFLSANPSWPSQTFLRRRIEAALWDDRRDDAAVWSWFENESPILGQGTLLARQGDDRAWRPRRRAPGARGPGTGCRGHRPRRWICSARCSRQAITRREWTSLLYGTEQEAAGMRAAKRLGSGYVALAKARIAANRRRHQSQGVARNAVPRGCTGDTGYLFARIQLLRREEKFAEAAQLMLSAPKDPGRLHNLDEWWIERRLLTRKMLDVGENRTAYLIARDAALPARDIYKTEQEFTSGWIALRFLKDPSTAAQHFARIGVGSVNPTALARAGYWQGRAAEAAGRAQEARAAYTRAAEQSTSYYGQLARAKLGLPQIDLNGAPRGRGAERLEVVRAAQLLYETGEPWRGWRRSRCGRKWRPRRSRRAWRTGGAL
jgi:soluble lytic murein transglycosylase